MESNRKMVRAVSALSGHPDFFCFLKQLRVYKMLHLSNLQITMAKSHRAICHTHRTGSSPNCFYCSIAGADEEMVMFRILGCSITGWVFFYRLTFKLR